jgi:hypothetical protein
MQIERGWKVGEADKLSLCRPHTPMIRFRKGLLDHGGEPTLAHRAGPAQAAAPSPQGPASAVLTGASSGAAASAGALGMEQSCIGSRK